MINVEDFLRENQIRYRLYEHPPVYTCEEMEKYHTSRDTLACKNLLLKDKKGTRFFLVILPAGKQADLKMIAELVGVSKVTFANANELMEKLSLKPGAVSIFGLINDDSREAELCIDKEVYDADRVSFHPNINTASVELDKEDFHKLLGVLKRSIKYLE